MECCGVRQELLGATEAAAGHWWAVGGLLGNSLVACWGGNLVCKKEISWDFIRAATRASGIHASFRLLGVADPCLLAVLSARLLAPD